MNTQKPETPAAKYYSIASSMQSGPNPNLTKGHRLKHRGYSLNAVPSVLLNKGKTKEKTPIQNPISSSSFAE